jgi:hypothetical protein
MACGAFHPAVTFCGLTYIYRIHSGHFLHPTTTFDIFLGFSGQKRARSIPETRQHPKVIARRPSFLTLRRPSKGAPECSTHDQVNPPPKSNLISTTSSKGARCRHRLFHESRLSSQAGRSIQTTCSQFKTAPFLREGLPSVTATAFSHERRHLPRAFRTKPLTATLN